MPELNWKQRFSGKNRELKQPRRRRQRQRHEFAYLTTKNDTFARFARAFFIFLHFADVLSQNWTFFIICSCHPRNCKTGHFTSWKERGRPYEMSKNEKCTCKACKTIFLVFTHVMRQPCWCTKQWQNVAQVLHNNRIKFPKDFFRYCSVHQCGRRDVTWKPRNICKFICKFVTLLLPSSSL